MPSAHSILWFLAAFVALWAVSLIWRGVRGDRSAGRRCPGCGYDLNGVGLKCPECGRGARRDSDLQPRLRRWRRVILGVVLLLVAAYLPRVAFYSQGGWRALIPTTVLIAGFEWLPEGAIMLDDPSQSDRWTLWGRWRHHPPWDWQKRWCVSQAQSLVERAATPYAMRRAIEFSGVGQSKSVVLGSIRASIPALERGDSDELEVASDLLAFIDNGLFLYRDEVADLIEPEVARLRRIMSDMTRSEAAAILAGRILAMSEKGASESCTELMKRVRGSGGVRGDWWPVLADAALISADVRAAALALVDDPDPAMAEACMLAFGRHRICDDATGRRLLTVLGESERARIAARAASTLLRCRWETDTVIRAVLDRIDEGHPGRVELCGVLVLVSEDMYSHLPRLVEFTSSECPPMRRAALRVLMAMVPWGPGLSGTDAVPMVERMVEDPAPEIAADAEDLLIGIRAREERQDP